SALILQAVGLLQNYIKDPETNADQAIRSAGVDALRELEAAHSGLQGSGQAPGNHHSAPQASGGSGF
ncbi:MAG TPA: hypothetical protein VGS41_03300, partial [Chthonomonadales bacterium]|nr:hypothetical protein [Chthonomonadales bacterium]